MMLRQHEYTTNDTYDQNCCTNQNKRNFELPFSPHCPYGTALKSKLQNLLFRVQFRRCEYSHWVYMLPCNKHQVYLTDYFGKMLVIRCYNEYNMYTIIKYFKSPILNKQKQKPSPEIHHDWQIKKIIKKQKYGPKYKPKQNTEGSSQAR